MFDDMNSDATSTEVKDDDCAGAQETVRKDPKPPTVAEVRSCCRRARICCRGNPSVGLMVLTRSRHRNVGANASTTGSILLFE